MAELKRLQYKIGDSLGWILDTLSQEDGGEPAVLRRKQALESLAYAKNILQGSISAVDDTKLLDEKPIAARVDFQEGVPPTHGLLHDSGYPTLPSSLPTTRLEAQRIVKLQNDNPERRRGLGHSSSSPSLNNLSIRPSPSTALPRTPWTPVHGKPAGSNPSPELAAPKPQQRSAPSSSRPIQTERPTKSPIQHDPLGVL